MSNKLNDFGLKIFLDRYAQKDTTKATLAIDDLVVVCTNQKTRQREVGNVRELIENPGNKPRVRIALLDGTEVTQDWDDVDKPTETTPEQTMARTARGIAAQEITDEKRAEWEERFKWLLDEWRFVPGGRILSAAGTEQNLTYFNCFDGKTLVHLDTGIVEIGTLNGTYNVLSQGGAYRPAEFKSYGFQQLWEVTLENGAVMHATAEHEWVVSKPKGGSERVYTRDLAGRMIPVNQRPKPDITDDYYAGVRNGIVYGDGTLANKGASANVYLFGEKMELEQYFNGLGSSHTHADATESYPEHMRIIGLDAALKSLPSEDASAAYWRGFIAGLLATDGNVDDRGSCALFSASEHDLRYIADNMAKAGYVHASIKMTRSVSPFDGSYKPVFALRLFKWCIAPEDVLRTSARAKFDANPPEKAPTIRVVSAVPTERIEEVFCCNEPETHTLTVGHGYLTGNCYVVPSPKDSRGGIIETLGNMMEIMSRGGGVGINLSSLRPRHNYVQGVNGRSSGSISWGGLYSFVTGLIEQGGSRRGALMLMLDITHPDVLDFIDAKREAGKITNANISVAISDAFMSAVENDADWHLVFPVTTHEAYDAEWNGDLAAWQAKGYPVTTHKTVKAREIWHKIAHSAWASAEPGILFSDRVNQMSNSHYFSRLICTNPCGEQPLPAWGICNLGAINLGVHVDDNGKVKWDELEMTVRYAVRFLDNVIDATPYFIDENKKQQQNERRVGLGIMGLAEMLIKCGVRYGSQAGVEFTDALGKFIAVAAYKASSDYAAEKGSFPAFDAAQLLESGFMKGMPADVRKLVKKQGLRNVTLLTVAPTGTTGTMVDTSTGVEPYFSWTYYRKSRLGMNEIEVDIVKDWRKANPDAKDLPDQFVTAMELTPEEHVGMQGALQRWIDSALSKTCNAPNNYTVENVKDLYRLMYELGCKGGTIYRDGSRDEQVLSLKKEEPKADPAPEVAVDIDAEARKLGYIKPEDVLSNPDLVAKVLAAVGTTHTHTPELKPRKRSSALLPSLDHKQQTHMGSCYTTATYDPHNEPLEIFVRSGKAGSDVSALAEGMGRLASLTLMMPSPLTPTERLLQISEQLEGIGGSDSYGFGKAKVKSMPDAVAKSLAIIAEELQARQAAPKEAVKIEAPEPAKPTRTRRKITPDICPSCGAAAYVREEGCMHCTSCGHSACG